MKAVTAFEMAEIDRIAQDEFGISQSYLMENAGRSVAREIISDIPDIDSLSVAVLCGKGNNGGDGFVAARYLREKKPRELTVYISDPDNIRSGSPIDNFKKILDSGMRIRPVQDLLFSANERISIDIFVDSLFGTGFKGKLPEEYRGLSDRLFTAGTTVYSVDIPSGLDATSGEAPGGFFKAFKTITFGLPKKGFYLGKGPQASGEIVIADIGFPAELIDRFR